MDFDTSLFKVSPKNSRLGKEEGREGDVYVCVYMRLCACVYVYICVYV